MAVQVELEEAAAQEEAEIMFDLTQMKRQVRDLTEKMDAMQNSEAYLESLKVCMRACNHSQLTRRQADYGKHPQTATSALYLLPFHWHGHGSTKASGMACLRAVWDSAICAKSRPRN